MSYWNVEGYESRETMIAKQKSTGHFNKIRVKPSRLLLW